MNFKEKIDNILNINDKDLRSLGQLEAYLGLGLHTLRKAIQEGREPTGSWRLALV